jgi:glycosyltransferase involved in cell wall biosynthesis
MNYSITIIILTYNEEANLPGLLKSIEGVNAHVFAVDSFSTDKTISLLSERGIQHIQHPFENYSHQRNWAQENNPYKTPWVLHLDAGERLTDEFVQWLQKSFNADEKNVDGYIFSRRTMIFGKEIKYGGQYPQYHLRLFRPEKGRCEAKMYDQHFFIEGNTKVIKNRVDIIDTVMDNWQAFIVGHARWAVFEAMQQVVSANKAQSKEGIVKANLWGSPIERKRWLKNNIFQKSPLFLRAFLFFIYSYFFKFGFLDGKTGLAFHFIQKLWFRFQVDAVILEFNTKMKKRNCSLETIVKDEYPENFQKLLSKIQEG